jgi:hypothetical protein
MAIWTVAFPDRAIAVLLERQGGITAALGDQQQRSRRDCYLLLVATFARPGLVQETQRRIDFL